MISNPFITIALLPELPEPQTNPRHASFLSYVCDWRYPQHDRSPHRTSHPHGLASWYIFICLKYNS